MLKRSNNEIIQLIFINLSIFLVLPFNLVIDKNNNITEYLLTEFFLLNLSIFLFFLIISIFFFFLLNFILPQSQIKIYKILNYFISFLFFWIFITGYFLPVTGEHDPFLNSFFSLRLRYIFIIKFFFILSLFIFLKKKKHFNKIQLLIVIYISINLLWILINLGNQSKEQIVPKLNSFGQKNLIVLSLDGISGYKFNKELLENLKLKKELKDFKFYKNVTSGWPATVNSLNAELNSQILEINNDNLETNILNDKNINSIVFGNYKHFMINKQKVVYRGNYKNYGRSYKANIFFQFITLGTFARWATPFIIPLFEGNIIYSNYYKKIFNLITFDSNNSNNPFNSSIHTKYMVHMNEFDLIFEESYFDPNIKQAIRMYHFSFTHWPVRLNEKCKEVKSLNVSIYDQEDVAIKCLSKKISYFLNKLIEKKIYQNSMIVIKSDHGKPNGFYDKFPLNLKINNSRYWGYGRYKTFIMIKNSNNENSEIESSEKHVFLHDLATTYCQFFYNLESCEKKYTGNNLASKNENFKTYNYDIYLPNKKNTFLNIKDFDKYNITNDISLYESLKLNNISFE